MKLKSRVLSIFSAFFSISLLVSCEKPADLPVEPLISFEKIMFKEVAGPDSLIIEINFQDGDGDLGLAKNENAPPWNPYNFITNPDGSRISFGSKEGLPPYSCLDWVIITSENRADTFLIERNIYHHNFIVDFFIKKNGVYEEYDWRKLQPHDCGENFYGRFPVLNTTGTRRALEGTLRYGMASQGFRLVFRNDTIKLRVQIIDRAQNKSNVMETPDFTLPGITVK
jgi:hypothetical protein